MLHVDLPFANRVSPYLENFKQKNQYLWNFSCPICGDMSKGRKKMRGYIYRPGNANHLNVKCHHCGYSASLGAFLKLQFPELFKEYVYTRYQETSKSHVPHKDITEVLPQLSKVPIVLKDSSMDGLKCCDALSDTHPVAKVLSKRLIPRDKWKLIYYTTKFVEYTNSLVPGKIDANKVAEHPRLVIPYLDAHGKMFAYVGRAFGKEEPRYYTIKLDDRDRVFGLDRVDYSKRIYVVEGAIDSLFLNNGIAVSGSNFDCETIRSIKSNVTLIPDNEPRSPEIVKLVKKHIELGYDVCMLPHSIITKDINEHVLSGMTTEDLHRIIDENTFYGIEAMARFVTWKLV